MNWIAGLIAALACIGLIFFLVILEVMWTLIKRDLSAHLVEGLKLTLLVIISFFLGAFLVPANADDIIVKYGAQIPKGQEGLGGTKSLFLAEQDRWFDPFIRQYEAGFWIDNVGNGRKSSAMASMSGGLQVNTGYVFAQALTGPAVITAPDSLLGSVLQFNNDLAAGLKDPDTKNTIGIDYKHVSSAGIGSPNRGRDFLMFRVSIKW